jgi:hypothetical protein
VFNWVKAGYKKRKADRQQLRELTIKLENLTELTAFARSIRTFGMVTFNNKPKGKAKK